MWPTKHGHVNGSAGRPAQGSKRQAGSPQGPEKKMEQRGAHSCSSCYKSCVRVCLQLPVVHLVAGRCRNTAPQTSLLVLTLPSKAWATATAYQGELHSALHQCLLHASFGMGHHRLMAICLLLALAAPGLLAAELHDDLQGTGRALLSRRREWGPTRGDGYDPERVDWNSVLLACKRLGEYERRFHGFNIRSAFHDGLAVDRETGTGGMDGSVFTAQERSQPQNEGFTAASWRVVKTIAEKYGCSVADALAVCGAVGVQELSNGRTKIIGPNGQRNFPVGRLDNPNPTGGRPEAIGPSADVTQAFTIWNKLGFSVEEGVALLGAHALFDNQGCSRSSRPGDVCDPNRQSCVKQLRMFKWDVHYYHNACTGTLRVTNPGRPDRRPAARGDLDQMLTEVQCGYTSNEYQQKRSDEIIRQWRNDNLFVPIDGVEWSNEQCRNSASFGVRNFCPHETDWPYTQNDAFMGRACQGLDMDQHPEYGPQVQAAMRRFLNAKEWDRVFAPAYIKMVSRFAMWANGHGILINGLECPSGYAVDSGCANNRGLNNADPRRACSNCFSSPAGGAGCHACCRCRTAWNSSRDKLVQEPEPFVSPGGQV